MYALNKLAIHIFFFFVSFLNTPANRCCGKLLACRHANCTPVLPQTPIACSQSRIRRARWQSSQWLCATRTTSSIESTYPIVQTSSCLSSFAKALIRNSHSGFLLYFIRWNWSKLEIQREFWIWNISDYRYIVEKTYRGSYGVFCVVFAHYTSSFARHRGIRMGWRCTFTPTLAIIRSSAQKKVTLSFRAHSKTIFIFFFFLCLFCHFILVVTRICVRPAYCLYRMSCSADTTLSNALPTLTCTCNCNYTKPFFRCLRKLLITFVTINIS